MDIAQATKKLILKDPFYGHFALGIKKEFSNCVPTAGATFESINPAIYFNEAFWGNLEENHQIGLLQHELMHIVMFHITNAASYADKELHNIAADICINQYIDQENLPPGGISLTSFPEIQLPPFLDAAEYYDLLDQKKQDSPKLQSLLNAMKGGVPTVCSHPLWGDVADLSDGMKEMIVKQIEHQVKETYEEHMNKNAGNLPGYLRDFVLNLYAKKKPTTDWKAVVRSFKSLCDRQHVKFTRNKINKRFPDMETPFLKRKHKMLVGIDTSGSIGSQELTLFFEQIYHISRAGVEIDIMECDAKIGRVYKFDKNNLDSKITGGGGTCFSPALEFLNKSRDHNGMIFFTDGYMFDTWTKISKPVLWVIVPNGTTEFAFPGKKIRMTL